jgi:undecaprenyl pyrophosphate phosphatase UppP
VQPDFFNNVAAIAVVLMFTKIVTHQSRKGKPDSTRTGKSDSIGKRGAFHATMVIAAAGAIVVALIATEVHSEATAFYILAWVMLGVAGLVLIIDEIREAQSG